jgi:hypothetical protein
MRSAESKVWKSLLRHGREGSLAQTRGQDARTCRATQWPAPASKPSFTALRTYTRPPLSQAAAFKRAPPPAVCLRDSLATPLRCLHQLCSQRLCLRRGNWLSLRTTRKRRLCLRRRRRRLQVPSHSGAHGRRRVMMTVSFPAVDGRGVLRSRSR